MKRLFILILLAAVLLSGCNSNELEILFDEATEGIVSVILKDYNDGTIHSDCIGPDGQRQPTQEFESDPVDIYSTPALTFDLDNTILSYRLNDENGDPVEVSETYKRIFELAAAADHNLLQLSIYQLEEHIFAVAQWNVNIWWPHVVYYYDMSADRLIELYKYDATQVVGLKTLNLPRS